VNPTHFPEEESPEESAEAITSCIGAAMIG
jgi:hypothetical protein